MSHISIHSLSYVLPNGRLLFSDLNESFGTERTALVGRNGTGKTVLAKIMADILTPTSGSVVRSGIVRYVDQIVAPASFKNAADMAGLANVISALERIEEGRGEGEDFTLADGNWDIRERLEREFKTAGLGHIAPETPATQLSGGESTRVSLVGAFLSQADFLILDEPTNHLDVKNKEALLEYLKTWRGGLLIISHDRFVLNRMERIVELSLHGLRNYGGNFALYKERKEEEHSAAVAHAEHLRTERKRTVVEQRESMERQQKRERRGKKDAAKGGIPKIIAGGLKRQAEITTGKLQDKHTEKLAEIAAAEYEASMLAKSEEPVVLIPPLCSVHDSKVVLTLKNLVLPYGTSRAPINFTIMGPERVAIEGANGSGKTTLLRVIMDMLAPKSGSSELKVPFAYLDQFAALPEDKSALQCLMSVSEGLNLGEAGTRLAQIGIAKERMHLPVSVLSGGERLKTALLCALHSTPPPQLLILDEPTNHLDLDSVESVEKVLNAYTGAILVVSHDRHFLENIGVSRRLLLEKD